jgi:Spy/CpxP family protein refolding chaperone
VIVVVRYGFLRSVRDNRGMRLQYFAVTVVTFAAASLLTLHADTPSKPNEGIVGAWTLNKDASQLAPARGDNGEGRDGDQGRRGDGSGGGGRRRGGGFGGGGFGRGGGGGGGFTQTPEQREAAQRMRDAMRQELQAPDHILIVSSETTIIITTPDGHTTRLAPDGKKIKDESTGVERKTKWDAGKLVSEVNGLGRGKITETYSIDSEAKQLRVKLDIDGPQKASQTRVYDLDPK